VKSVENVVTGGLSHLDADYDPEVDLPEMTPKKKECSQPIMANLDGLDNNEYSFNNQPDVYDMAEIFINKFEEQETYFPVHPPLIKKYQDKDKQLEGY
jgi:hypothetical protein